MPGLELSSPRTLTPALLLFVGVGIGALYAADGPPDQGIPYQGRLELAGQPYSGMQTLAFRIWDGPDVGSATMLHEEEQTASIAAGAFGVLLGEGGLPDAVFTSDALYLQVGVGALAGANWLAGTQRILPATQSVRAGRAYNFDVEGPVLSGPTDFTITNGSGTLRFGNGGGNSNNEPGDVAALLGADGEFTVEGSSGTQHLVVGDAVGTRAAELEVTGPLHVGVNLVTCPMVGVDHEDCFCSAGEVAIAGGVYGSSAATARLAMRESRPVYDAVNDRYGWRGACMSFYASGGLVYSENAACAGDVYALCARLAPD